MKATKAKVFWTGRRQAIRLPKEFRFATDTVLVHREGQAVVVEPCLEMICADFLAGAHLEGGNPKILLLSMTRLFRLLPATLGQQFLQQVTEAA
jgi:virulence-associated protein VagC